jgi:large subunit ribosomal protein L18
MDAQKRKTRQQQRRRYRVRGKMMGTAQKPRLSVFRSSKHIYAQLIDDVNGVTLAAAGSLGKQMTSDIPYGGNIKAAQAIGRMIAEKAREKGIEEVAFDRGPYKYHGRVKALADAAREGGLKF